MSEGAVYVYGVVAAADAGSFAASGVEEADVRSVREGELAALVSDLRGGALTAARELRAHWRVLDQASARATVIPVRFGTVMSGDHAVRDELLAPNAERLGALLGELEGRVQVTVKGTYAQDALLGGIVAASPAVAAMRERLRGLPGDAGYYERIRLGELVAAEVDRCRQHDAAHALAELEPLAVAARVEAAGGADAAFHLAFLVERELLDAFSAAVGELAGELGDRIAVRYVGPLAPYSFANADLAAGAV
jgi:hypothetical protein